MNELLFILCLVVLHGKLHIILYRVAAGLAGSGGEVGAIAAGGGAGFIDGFARGRSRRFCGDFEIGAVAGVVVCGGEVETVVIRRKSLVSRIFFTCAEKSFAAAVPISDLVLKILMCKSSLQSVFMKFLSGQPDTLASIKLNHVHGN